MTSARSWAPSVSMRALAARLEVRRDELEHRVLAQARGQVGDGQAGRWRRLRQGLAPRAQSQVRSDGATRARRRGCPSRVPGPGSRSDRGADRGRRRTRWRRGRRTGRRSGGVGLGQRRPVRRADARVLTVRTMRAADRAGQPSADERRSTQVQRRFSAGPGPGAARGSIPAGEAAREASGSPRRVSSARPGQAAAMSRRRATPPRETNSATGRGRGRVPFMLVSITRGCASRVTVDPQDLATT